MYSLKSSSGASKSSAIQNCPRMQPMASSIVIFGFGGCAAGFDGMMVLLATPLTNMRMALDGDTPIASQTESNFRFVVSSMSAVNWTVTGHLPLCLSLSLCCVLRPESIMLGHKDVRTTMGYVRRRPRDATEAQAIAAAWGGKCRRADLDTGRGSGVCLCRGRTMENRETGGAALLDAPGTREYPEECLYKGKRPGCTRGTPAGCPLEEPEPEEGAGGCIYDRCGGCPCFDLAPNAETIEAMEEDPALCKSYATVEEMMADILGDDWEAENAARQAEKRAARRAGRAIKAELLADAGS